MATKKASSKKASKKAGGTKKSAKKSSSKKTAAKKTAAKKTAAKVKPSKCKCTGWKAWQNNMPPGPSRLYVTGQCRCPNPGYKVTLKEAVPQGINPAILLLNKIERAPTGPVIQPIKVVEVRFEKKTNRKYTHVTILPDLVTIKVQQVS